MASIYNGVVWVKISKNPSISDSWCYCPKMEQFGFYYTVVYPKGAGRRVNSVGHDKTAHIGASYLGLHCLLRCICSNTCTKKFTVGSLVVHMFRC